MSRYGVRSAGRVRRSLIAVGALATVLVPGSPAEAAASVGRFTTLPAGDALGLEVDGVAVLRRTSDATWGRVVLERPVCRRHGQPGWRGQGIRRRGLGGAPRGPIGRHPSGRAGHGHLGRSQDRLRRPRVSRVTRTRQPTLEECKK